MERGPLAGDGGAGRVLIPRRFNGPPASANGGYAAGLVARYIRGPAEVSLRLPPPLDTALALTRSDDERVLLCHREQLVAEGAAGRDARRRAARASRPSPRRARRCAGIRGEAPGTRSATATSAASAATTASGLHFGDLPGEPSMTAALLIADATIPHDDHGILPEIAWAALDCPSYVPALWSADVPSLLAWMQAELHEPIPLGEPIVACGWPLERGGAQAATPRRRC